MKPAVSQPEANSQPMSKDQLKTLISQNAMVSIMANTFYLITRLFIPPLTLSMVSLEEYGIWACCFIVIGYLGMGAFGISNSFIRYVGVYDQKRDMDAINRLISTGLAITTLGGTLVLVILWFAMPKLISLFSIAPELGDTASVLFFGTVFIFMCDLSFGSFAYVLVGLQRIVPQKIVWVLSYCFEALLIVALLFSGLGIYSLLWAFVLRYLFSIAANIVLCYRALPGLSLRPSLVDRRYLKHFLHFGGIVQINGILAMVLGSFDKLLTGLVLNAKAVAVFDLGQKFPRMAMSIPGAITQVIFPATTYLEHGDRRGEIGKLYIKSSRYINLITGTLMGFMAPFALLIMTAWLGNDEAFELAAVLLVIFTLPFQFHITTGPGSAVFKGLGRPGRETFYPLARIAFTATFCGLAFVFYGWSVVSIGVAVAAAILLSAFAYMVYTLRCLELNFGTFLRKVLVPGCVPYLIGLAWYWLMAWLLRPFPQERWSLVAMLAGMGVVYVLSSGAISWFLVCDWGERQYLRRQINAVIKPLWRRWRGV